MRLLDFLSLSNEEIEIIIKCCPRTMDELETKSKDSSNTFLIGRVLGISDLFSNPGKLFKGRCKLINSVRVTGSAGNRIITFGNYTNIRGRMFIVETFRIYLDINLHITYCEYFRRFQNSQPRSIYLPEVSRVIDFLREDGALRDDYNKSI